MSDVIDRAIKKKYHINDLSMLRDIKWEDFEAALRNKSLFLYGLGNAVPFLWEKYGNTLCVTGCIDIDKKTQGDRWELRVASFSHPMVYESEIASPEVLEKYDPEGVVILVLSIKQYPEICRELANKGYRNVFSLLTMEAKERETEQNRKEQEDIVEIWLRRDRELPIIQNKILILIGVHGGHGRAITKSLLKIKRKIEIVWIVNRYIDDTPDRVYQVHEKNLYEYYYAINTAKIIIIDVVWNLPEILKKDGQIFIQAKHWSSITLKKFGAEDNISNALRSADDAKTWDYILTGSKFDEESCKSGFPGAGECVDVGSPRSDAMFDNSIRNKIYKHYDINKDYHTLLYAPTFRVREKDGIAVKYDGDVDFRKLRDALRLRFCGEWIILLRYHPLLAEIADLDSYPDCCINVSDYEDMEDLASAADCMASDYSSIMFEPSFVKKPVFLYAPDRNEYVNKEKMLLIDYNTLPFPIAETNEQLAENIMNFDQEKYEADVTAFLDKYGVHEDGHASERAAEVILGLMNEAKD